MKRVQGGVLAIGSEVIQGQVVNGHASWLSAQMDLLEIDPFAHLACRDQAPEIHSALDFLFSRCSLILVTGGLGPTSDDCTRQSLSHWLGEDLVFHSDQWEEIQAKLSSRGVTLRSSHRQQAFFPKGSEVLSNTLGVAPGFWIQKKYVFLACLPGPSSELRPMFSRFLAPKICRHLSPSRDWKIYRWLCFGAPESELAHITETFLGSTPHLSRSYRLHRPYVEVKVQGPKNPGPREQELLKGLSKRLAPWFVAESVEEIRQEFSRFLENYDSIFIEDGVTRGVLLEKLKSSPVKAPIHYRCWTQPVGVWEVKDEKRAKDKKKHVLDSEFIWTKSLDSFPKDQIRNPSEARNLWIQLEPGSQHHFTIIWNGVREVVQLPPSRSLDHPWGQAHGAESVFLMGINRGKKSFGPNGL